MAKRKLSESQRASIRKEIAELLRKGTSKAETLRTVAKKYGITTITARWYLKNLKTLPVSVGKKPAAKKPKAAAVRKGRRAVAHRNGSGPKSGPVHRLVANIKAIAEETFTRGRLAKSLIPQWQAYVRKEFTLKKVERRVRRQLGLVSKKAQALHRKIRALTSS